MQIREWMFPGGVSRALTMSYDDGSASDRKLAGIFDSYGIRGTFHLNSGNLDREGYLTRAELADVLKNHEVSAHTVHHPYPARINDQELKQEIWEDRRTLEKLCGYPVRGMSYPYGEYNCNVIETAKSCGMEYSRTVLATGSFEIPEDFMQWHPTAHHNGALDKLWERFIGGGRSVERKLFYVWGHSFEFDRDNNWDRIEEFCKKAGGHDSIWYASNMEIKEYVTAVKGIVYSADDTMAYNPSCMDVWFWADGAGVCVPAGKQIRLG